jgi:hypothetical protein
VHGTIWRTGSTWWRGSFSIARVKVFASYSIDVLSYIYRALTHGEVFSKANSGRSSNVWIGVVQEFEARLRSSSRNIVNREGRLGLKLPDFVSRELRLEQFLLFVLQRLRSVMPGKPRIRTHNVVMVPSGIPEQRWHVDGQSFWHVGCAVSSDAWCSTRG